MKTQAGVEVCKVCVRGWRMRGAGACRVGDNDDDEGAEGVIAADEFKARDSSGSRVGAWVGEVDTVHTGTVDERKRLAKGDEDGRWRKGRAGVDEEQQVVGCRK